MATSFIDKARISVRAGNGGNGSVSFHREKYVAAGGPDGGDGGRGGSITLQVDDNMSTLMDFRYKRKYEAGNGADGQGARKTGKDGTDLVIKVPRGTLVRDAETGEIMQDMSGSEPYVLCKGGRGGWGNSHFATPTRQVPRFAKAGLPGEAHDVILELKLLADVGLVGFPNVGKSTLLSVVSKAQPKIANYHFTTLFPNLGVVWVEDGVSFVMADIPGIIEGASEGAGQSTFMVEMTEVADILRHATKHSLLILDEIGRGTSTFDGMSIARAVLEYCADKKLLGAKTLFATHYHELTELENTLPGTVNYNIAVKTRGEDIIFLRKILPGGADRSYGIEVAKLAGLPDKVVQRAKTVLKELEEENGVQYVAARKEEDQVSLTAIGEGEVLDALRRCQPDTLTPIEAMSLIYEWKQKLN